MTSSNEGTADPAALQRAVARLAVGVAVVTTMEGGRPHGCTGMAWAEGGDPLLLTTLRTDGTTRRLVEAAGAFGISILGADQAGLTRQFARRADARGDRFDGVPWRPGPVHGMPVLDGCPATFECAVRAIHPFGSHDIVVGQIDAVTADGPQPPGPSVHYERRLWRLAELS